MPGTSSGRRKEFEDRGGGWNVRESRDERDFASGNMTGDRAEMSKDRRYESKDSREILKGSFSLKTLLLLVVLLDELAVQKLLRSGGEGGTKTPLSLISDMSPLVQLVTTGDTDLEAHHLADIRPNPSP